MNIRLFFLSLFCLQALGVSAQSIPLSGIVTDQENGEPLPYVIVLLKPEGEKTVLRYVRTDEKGAFALKTSTLEKRTLTFSFMGYGEVTLPLVEGKSVYNVSLAPQAIQIKEVIVKAPKVNTRGDTIVYNVSRFADVQDKSIADVLKKMSGIDVEKNGTIRYNGKSINKFYIEGMDMLEGRYGIATNSIPQKDVSSIEVMENHQPVKALAKTEFSEQAALNIKLKKDARARWLATLQAGGGASPALWEGDLSLMRFKGASQQMFTYKGNNTGNEITRHHRVMTAGDVGSAMGNGYDLSSYVGMQASSAPNLNGERTLFNRSHTVSSNQLLKLGKDYQLTTRLLYANDRRTSEYASRTEYFLADSLIATETQDHTKVHTDALTAEATLQANTEKYFLKNTLGADLSWNSGDGRVEGTYPNLEHTYSKAVKISNSLRWVKNIGRQTFTLTSINSYQRKPESLLVARESAVQSQRIASSAFFTQTTVGYGWNFRSFTLTLNGGVAGVWRSLESDLQGVPDSLGVLNIDSPLDNWHLFASPKLQYKENGWVLTFDAPLHYHSSLEGGYCSPHLFAYWDMTARWAVSMNAQLAYRPTTDANRYDGLLMQNYRTLRQGYGQTEKQETRSSSLTLSYKNPLKTFFANLSFPYTYNKNPLLTQQLFLGDYIISGYLPQTTEGELYRASGKLSKGIDWWELVATLSASYSDSHMQMKQNGVLQPYRSGSLGTQLKLSARPARWCSWDYELSYQRNRLKSDFHLSSTNHLMQTLSFSVKPTDRWRVELSGEHYRNALSQNLYKSVVLLDAECSYRLSSRCELTCRCSNLLNQKRYAYTLYGDLSRSYAEYEIRPFNAVMSLYYKF